VPDASLVTRLRYRFDNALARGPFVVIAYLGALTLLLVLLAAGVATLADITFGGGLDGSFPEALWQSLLRMVDAGTFAADGAWPTRLLGVAITLAGIFVAGSLIGLIANAVDQRVEELRRGRGAVVESGHTLVLGWSPQVPRIIGELVVANESEKDASVVVLARTDKTEMDDVLRDRVPERGTTRVVTRRGDLERACVLGAKSIIVVRDEEGDAGVVKAILGVKALDPELATCHVVAEVEDLSVARTLRTVTGGRVLTVSSDRVVAEVTAQACLQRGLAAVFADLLDFDGDEVYFTPAGAAAGHAYGEVQLGFEASCVIGRLRADGRVELNPPPDAVIDAGDELILIAEDDSAVAFTGIARVPVPTPATTVEPAAAPVRVLIVGWSEFGRLVLEQLDEFLVPGSTVTVHVDADLVDPSSLDDLALVNAELHVRAGCGGPESLLGLEGAEDVDQVIVLAYGDALADSEADARTLLTLLTLRLLFPAGAPDEVRIVAELADQRNLVLARPVGIDDLIVSDAMASLYITQLAERAELQAVFEELLEPDGAIVTLRPAPNLVGPEPVPFAAVVAAGAAQGRSVFGYRLGATDEVVVNPPKSIVVTLRDGDDVVLLEHRARGLSPEKAHE
jgi:ion channel POLLUX/CASTOR